MLTSAVAVEPQDSAVFLFNESAKFVDGFILKLKAAGIDKQFFSIALGGQLSLALKGTKLTATKLEKRYPGDDMQFYKLYYNGVELAETRIKSALYQSYTNTFIRTAELQDLPGSLLKPSITTEEVLAENLGGLSL